MSELMLAVPPCTSLSPHRELSPVLFTCRDQHPSAAASDLVFIRWERWLWVGRQPVIGGFRCRGAAQPCASIPGMDADLFRILSNAVEELGLEWFPSVEQSRSRLDEWFLPGRHQAPRQRASPFFPNVHDEINKSCREPYSFRLRVSSSSALTSVDGAEEKGYDSLPPLDESVAAHICLPTAIGKSLPAV